MSLFCRKTYMQAIHAYDSFPLKAKRIPVRGACVVSLLCRPGSLMRSILAVLRTALFWVKISDVVPGSTGATRPALESLHLVLRLSLGPLLPSPPHIFLSSSLNPWYFFSFLCSFFLVAYFCLSTTTNSSWLASTILSICI